MFESMENNSRKMQQMIEFAILNNKRTCVAEGDWVFTETVIIPSDFKLVLKNCHITMAEGTFCNMFRNKAAGTFYGTVAEGCDKNIFIEGIGDVFLDGGVYNGLSERNCGIDGNPEIFVNNTILFSNAENFGISGLKIINQRWWGINLLFCRKGKIENIEFCSDDSYYDEDGNLICGLDHNRHLYDACRILNSDGIDIRSGCSDIEICSISGFTQDDTVALTCLPGKMEQHFKVDEIPYEIQNISIKNIKAASYCAIVRMLAQGGTKIRNVTVDGVYDTSADCSHVDRTGFCVRIGDESVYYDRQPLGDEMRDITVTNVKSRAYSSVPVVGEVKNLQIGNVEIFDGGGDGNAYVRL